jgi:hypothetical protein
MTNNNTGAFAPQTGTVYLNELPPGARVVTFAHRSGAESHMACPRRYYLNYLYLGRGITPSPGPLYFAVGTAVHHGLAHMLLEHPIDECISVALDSLFNSAAFIALDNPDLQGEQETLVHGLLYAFYVYAYPGLAANFEVLAVETGAVEYIPLVIGQRSYDPPLFRNGEELLQDAEAYVAMQSRPDAILRNKQTHEVCGISWKTIDDPSDMRRSQLVNDLQGFMEQYYGERILEKLAGAPVTMLELHVALTWALEQAASNIVEVIHRIQSDLTTLEERARAARNIPTEIDYIQTIFLVKGPRKLVDGGEGVPFPTEWGQQDEYGGYAPGKIYRQMSPLCYRYRNGSYIGPLNSLVELYKTGPNKGKPKHTDPNDPNLQEQSWLYRFYKPGNESMNALSTKWLTSQIYPDGIRDWVDRLNRGEIYPSTMNDERNPHPLAKIIRFEEPLYKDAARSASHVKQQKERFVQIAQDKMELSRVIVNPEVSWDAVSTLSDCMRALDCYFPQHLISCKTPYRCQYLEFCHGATSLDFVSIPDGYEQRVAHHAAEREYIDGGADGAGE